MLRNRSGQISKGRGFLRPMVDSSRHRYRKAKEKRLTSIPIPVRFRLLTPMGTIFRMTHDTGVLAVEDDILGVFVGVFGVLEGAL